MKVVQKELGKQLAEKSIDRQRELWTNTVVGPMIIRSLISDPGVFLSLSRFQGSNDFEHQSPQLLNIINLYPISLILCINYPLPPNTIAYSIIFYGFCQGGFWRVTK